MTQAHDHETDEREGESAETGRFADHPVGPQRWVCRCSSPPVLLATIESGNVNLKIRDRYYHIEGVHGRVRATCPRCGKEHVLSLAGA